jgi:hypothetical protein
VGQLLLTCLLADQSVAAGFEIPAAPNDQKRFKPVEAGDPAIIRLRELSRLDEELKNELRRATNQLWEQLHRYFPQILKLSSGVDELFV